MQGGRGDILLVLLEIMLLGFQFLFDILHVFSSGEMAVDDAAFIHCWGLPAADSEEADLITIGDSVSQHSMDAHMPVSELVLTSPCGAPTGWCFRVKDEQVAVGLCLDR